MRLTPIYALEKIKIEMENKRRNQRRIEREKMWVGFTSFHNENWVCFDKKPKRFEICGHKVRWNQVIVNEKPIEEISILQLRKMVEKYDNNKNKNKLDYKRMIHFDFEYERCIENIRLYLQFRALSNTFHISQDDIEKSREDMNKYILDNITLSVCHNLY